MYEEERASQVARRKAALPKKIVSWYPPIVASSLCSRTDDPRLNRMSIANASCLLYNRRVRRYVLIRKSMNKKMTPILREKVEGPNKVNRGAARKASTD